MARLSSPIDTLKDHYDVVVIGSGYGGGIAASRLSRAGKSVCLLERGKEFQPGEYPDTLLEAAEEFQTDSPAGHLGSKTGLYEMVVNDEINVFKGCGLGGTSLINANVSLRAEDRVFLDPAWPDEYRKSPGLLGEAYTLAEQMLKPTPYPENFPKLPKLEAQAKSAALLKSKLVRAPINVTFEDGVNHVGVEQKACNLCGDCVTGCNHHAKNTLIMNYLPDARNHGAEIFTKVSVRHVEKKGDKWLVHYQLMDTGRESFSEDTLTVSADVVVVSAGSLGSTEILLRSKAKGLSLSDKVGNGFTGNGDVLAFAYNCDEEINGVGFGEKNPDQMQDSHVGPCITGVIEMRNQPNLEDGMVIEEGSIPGALHAMLPAAMAAASATIGQDTDTGFMDAMKEKALQAVSFFTGAYHGAIRNSQTFLVMSHDGSDGKMGLVSDRLRIKWPGVGDRPGFKKVNQNLKTAATALGGTFIKNPIWSKLTNHELVTVHPLGGCGMGDAAESGVTNHKGQVFAGPSGKEVHTGLYVADGAVIPRSLGVNPLLTISAVAERSMALLANDRGWKIDYSLKNPVLKMNPDPKPGVQFTETMKGYFSLGATDFQSGWEQGQSKNSPFSFILTVTSDDANAMLKDPDHKAGMIGTVEAPALSKPPLTSTEAVFQLFVADPKQVGVRNMVYNMKMSADDGTQYRFNGYKVIHDDKGFDLWSDTTTLYITVWSRAAAPGAEEKEIGKGILKILPLDFMKQMASYKAINCKSTAEKLKVISAFGKFFAGSLYDTYGGVFARATVFNPDAPPRKKRALALPVPTVVPFKTEDGVSLLLTRYQGGKKGPVILVPGMGTSTLAFTIDTIDMSLGEYLCGHGYDVWMFDYRASSALPAQDTQFSIDEIGRYDYPAAIAKVKEMTGAPDVQLIAHCVGAAGFQMGVLGGSVKGGVRSAILSQFTAHIDTVPLLKIKAGLHLANFLQSFGVDVLTTEFDTKSGWVDQMYDKMLRLYPTAKGQTCDNPVCRRIRFMWGEVYQHEQLNNATHLAIHEMFGHGNITVFEHISAIARNNQIVDKQGNDVYLPHLDRMNFPITIIQGGKNLLFQPEGSEKTYQALCQRNGQALYRREVFPEYAHMDCFIGKDAARDIFPYLLSELDRFNA